MDSFATKSFHRRVLCRRDFFPCPEGRGERVLSTKRRVASSESHSLAIFLSRPAGRVEAERFGVSDDGLSRRLVDNLWPSQLFHRCPESHQRTRHV